MQHSTRNLVTVIEMFSLCPTDTLADTHFGDRPFHTLRRLPSPRVTVDLSRL